MLVPYLKAKAATNSAAQCFTKISDRKTSIIIDLIAFVANITGRSYRERHEKWFVPVLVVYDWRITI